MKSTFPRIYERHLWIYAMIFRQLNIWVITELFRYHYQENKSLVQNL